MKKISTIIVGSMIVATLLAPVAALANDNDNENENGTQGAKAVGSFCVSLTNKNVSRETRFAENVKRVTEKKAENDVKLANKRAEIDDDRAERRGKMDENLSKRSQRMYERKAVTDAQKLAVTTFKTTVEAAMKTRQAAIDLASKAFRDAADKIRLENKTALDAIKKTHEDAVKAALTKAQADCAAGKDAQTVRTDLAAALKAARDTFNTAKNVLVGPGSKIEELAKVKNDAFAKAKADYKAAVDAAKAILAAAFPTITTN